MTGFTDETPKVFVLKICPDAKRVSREGREGSDQTQRVEERRPRL